jgi:lysophospholipase L1-like esterase
LYTGNILKLKEKYHLLFRKAIPFIFFALLAMSCTKENAGIVGNAAGKDSIISDVTHQIDTGKKTYLALGDSYTVGASVAAWQSFPEQLTGLLKNGHINIASPDIIAVSGWTTADLLNSLQTNPPLKNYSFVTLLIGVNNQYQGRQFDEYKVQFTELLNLAVSYAGNQPGHVIVLSIPDYGVTPFGSQFDKDKIAGQIDLFNAANKAIAEKAGAAYVDITAISRNAEDEPSLTARDGLHPSPEQYYKWVQKLYPLVLEILTN